MKLIPLGLTNYGVQADRGRVLLHLQPRSTKERWRLVVYSSYLLPWSVSDIDGGTVEDDAQKTGLDGCATFVRDDAQCDRGKIAANGHMYAISYSAGRKNRECKEKV